MPSEKERFCEEKLVQNTKQPGMLKMPVGLGKKKKCFLCIFLCANPEKQHAPRQNPKGHLEPRP